MEENKEGLVGGLAGHMSHLYDNPRLTFGQIKRILQDAAEGELEGTEEETEQNLYISFSVPSKSLNLQKAVLRLQETRLILSLAA